MRRQCGSCGTEFEAKRAAATYCSDRCRVRAYERRKAGNADGSATPPVASVESSTRPQAGSVTSSTLARLESAGVEGEPVAQSALALARRIDNGQSETGSSLAALVREHRAALADALQGAEKQADPLDELRERRERRRAG